MVVVVVVFGLTPGDVFIIVNRANTHAGKMQLRSSRHVVVR